MIQEAIIKQGQKFILWPTPITSTSLDIGVVRGLVFKNYSPPCTSLLSASFDGCLHRHSNRMSLRARFKNCLPHLAWGGVLQTRAGKVTESLPKLETDILCSGEEEKSQFSTKRHVFLEGWRAPVDFKTWLWCHLHVMTDLSTWVSEAT